MQHSYYEILGRRKRRKGNNEDKRKYGCRRRGKVAIQRRLPRGNKQLRRQTEDPFSTATEENRKRKVSTQRNDMHEDEAE